MEYSVFNIVEFDFEQHIQSHVLPPLDPADDPSKQGERQFIRIDPKFRTIVCTHWMQGLCSLGDECKHLHRLDKSKMPICKHGKSCKIRNCPLKHGDQEANECIFFKQGFCYNGPACQRRHIFHPPEECPPEASFDSAFGSGGAAAFGHQQKRPKMQINENFKVTLCKYWLIDPEKCTYGDGCIAAHGEEEIRDGQQLGSAIIRDSEIYDPTRLRMDAPLKLPFSPSGPRTSYFLLQSPDLRSLLISQRTGRWAVPFWIRDEINTSLNSSDRCIVLFSVRALKGVYGVAEIGSQVPPPVIGSSITREFAVRWIRTIRLSMRSISQMKIESSGIFIGKALYDSKLDCKVGVDLLHAAFRKPEWDWTQEFDQASYIPPEHCTADSYFVSEEVKKATALLPPNQLFPEEWVKRMASSGPEVKRFRPQGPRGHQFGPPTTFSGNVAAFASNPPAATNFYNGNSPGYILWAHTPIVNEMLQRKLFGFSAPEQIDSAAPLFLYDMDRQMMLGIFQAETAMSENIDPSAFAMLRSLMGFPPVGSPLPYQIRVQLALSGNPISAMDPELRALLGHINLAGFLPLKETKVLADLFATRAGVFQGKSFSTAATPATNVSGPLGVSESKFGQQGVYRPPFKFVDVVNININADVTDVKKRVLGFSASNLLKIIDESGGNRNNVKIRIRGKGSGFFESNGQEMPEVLHLNVSADSEALLAKVSQNLRQFVAGAKAELEAYNNTPDFS